MPSFLTPRRFVPCFLPGAKAEAVPITDDNRHLLRSEYQARTADELPVEPEGCWDEETEGEREGRREDRGRRRAGDVYVDAAAIDVDVVDVH